jgi:hypothetical protein
VIDNPATPPASPRARGPLAAILLVVAVSAFGCGAATSAERKGDGVTHVRLSADRPPMGNPGIPADDDDRPTVSNLDPDLLAAVRAAASDAQQDGVGLVITSGWRSRAHQQRLYDEAVRKYGSEQEARRYVSTPDVSAHVTGDAVDIGPTEADDWFIQHGADYGLCQVFANEIWHFELATNPGGECPPMLPDRSYRG